MTRTRALATLLFAPCLVGLATCTRRATTERPQPAAATGEVLLDAAQVATSKLVVAPLADQYVGGVLATTGRVTFDDLKVAHVFSPVTGRVLRIEAQHGQRVKKGAALALIESPDVGTAFSDLSKAEADLTAAQREWARQRELYEAHAGSQKDYEAAEDAYGRAKAEVERARQKARLLRGGATDRISQEYTLRAPIDGEVIARSVNPGAEVQGLYSGGTPVELFTLGELDRVWVVADVYEVDLARVKPGARVTVTSVAYPGKVFVGKVDWIAGSLDPQTRTAKLRCAIDNGGRELKPEMYVTASVAVEERKALAIPRSALLRLGEQTVVFVQAGAAPDGRVRFERRPVAVNEDDGGDFLPVTHGLERGEQVVTAGAILLSGML